MNINVTHLMVEDCGQFSGSICELGENAGQITWRNSMEEASKRPLVSGYQIAEVTDWLAESGAWTREDMATWTEQEFNALLIQFVASDIRESERFDSWEEYESAQRSGVVSSYLYRDGERYFFQLSN